MKGKVYLVGAGPGDPGLITQRGVELLRRADVVVHDRLASEDLLRYARPEARLYDVGANGQRRTPQAIRRLIERHASAGRIVVRLKAGDPFIFGRGAEEAGWFAEREIPFEVVPGVTAALASAAYAGIPLTQSGRASKVTFVTGRMKGDGPIPEVAPGGTLVIYMGVRTLPSTMELLVKRGWDPNLPAAIVECGTLPEQRLVMGTLSTIAERAAQEKIRPPAVTILGATVEMRRTLAWFERRPFAGLRIIVTRARDQAGDLAGRLQELGAAVIEYPTVEIEPVSNWKHLDTVLRDLPHYDAVVFTSQNAVPFVFARLRDLGLDARALAGLRVAAVGPATREVLLEHGIRPDWVADEYTTAKLAKKIVAELPPGARVLHPGADKRSPYLEAGLRKGGIHVRNVDVYRIVRPRHRVRLRSGDLVTFASAQTVRNFASMTRMRPPAACIGPVTAKAARKYGFKVVAMAQPYTIPGLVEAIEKWRAEQKKSTDAEPKSS